MTTNLKRLLGEAGAGFDASSGETTLYDLLSALITQISALTTSHNQLLTDYNDEDQADHTTSTAVAVTALVDIE